MRDATWLRTLLCVAFASMGSAAALAKQISVDRIDIVTFGIFSSGTVTSSEARPGTNGITLREGRKLLSRTETVPGVVGATFGIQYIVRGAPKGQVVKLTSFRHRGW